MSILFARKTVIDYTTCQTSKMIVHMRVKCLRKRSAPTFQKLGLLSCVQSDWRFEDPVFYRGSVHLLYEDWGDYGSPSWVCALRSAFLQYGWEIARGKHGAQDGTSLPTSGL